MTSPDPMTREELIELAPLDAFGLLDDYEAALFNRSFHHAPAAVQAEIRAIQAELAENTAFLSAEDPRALLRQKVLLRISEEVEETAEQLKPLAQIGGTQAALGQVGGSLAPIGTTATVPAGNAWAGDSIAGPDEAMRELVAEIRARSSAATRDRATPYWRAAAFFLAAGLVVSLYFLGRTMRSAEEVFRFAQNQALQHDLAALVPSLKDFAYRDSHIRGMTSSDPSVNAAATLYIDPEHERVLVVALGLSECKGAFTLRAVDDRGNATVLFTFNTTDPVHGRVEHMVASDVFNQKLELLDADGKVILRTA